MLSKKSGGFTIVEVMAVLIVSSILVITGLGIMSGQRQRTEFTTELNELSANINEIVNNVATGYFDKRLNAFTCRPAPSPTIEGSIDIEYSIKLNPDGSTTSVYKNTGTNLDCTYVGKILHVKTQPMYFTYVVVGRRVNDSGEEVTKMEDLKPIIVYADDQGIGCTAPCTLGNNNLLIDASIARKFKYMTPNSITFPNPTTGNKESIGGVIFLRSFPSQSGSGVTSGSQSVDLYVPYDSRNNGIKLDYGAKKIPDVGDGVNSSFVSWFNGGTTNPNYPGNSRYLTKVKSVEMCFNSNQTNEHAIVTIGKNNRNVSTTIEKSEGKCS